MGFISRLKDKIIGRSEERDFDTVRANVLGDYAPPVNQVNVQQPSWRSKYEETAVPREFSQPSLETMEEPHGLEIKQPFGQQFSEDENKHKWDRKDYYELFDRLGVIEAQLAAIRSQTETINERLKMLEIRITRRY